MGQCTNFLFKTVKSMMLETKLQLSATAKEVKLVRDTISGILGEVIGCRPRTQSYH